MKLYRWNRFKDRISYRAKTNFKLMKLWFQVGRGKNLKKAVLGLCVTLAVLFVAILLINKFDTEKVIEGFFTEAVGNIRRFFTKDLGKYLEFVTAPLKTGQKVLLGLTAFYVLRLVIEIFRRNSEFIAFWVSFIFYTLTMLLMSGTKAPYERYLIAAAVWIAVALVLQIVTAVCMSSDNIILRVCITAVLSAVAAFVGYWFGLAVKHPYEITSLLIFTVFFLVQLDAIFDEFSGSSTPVIDTIEDVVGGMVGDEVDLSDVADM